MKPEFVVFGIRTGKPARTLEQIGKRAGCGMRKLDCLASACRIDARGFDKLQEAEIDGLQFADIDAHVALIGKSTIDGDAPRVDIGNRCALKRVGRTTVIFFG